MPPNVRASVGRLAGRPGSRCPTWSTSDFSEQIAAMRTERLAPQRRRLPETAPASTQRPSSASYSWLHVGPTVLIECVEHLCDQPLNRCIRDGPLMPDEFRDQDRAL